MNKTEANKYSRKYYKENSGYRKKKIEQRKEYYQENKKSQAEYAKEYYHKNPQYRQYKISYAKSYRKAHKN